MSVTLSMITTKVLGSCFGQFCKGQNPKSIDPTADGCPRLSGATVTLSMIMTGKPPPGYGL